MRLRNLNQSLVPEQTAMTASSRQGIKSFLAATLTALLVVAMSLAPSEKAFAGPITRSNNSLQVRAGVLIIDSNIHNGAAVPANDAPYVWFNLDNNLLVKPAGWSFYNPYGSTIVTQAIFNRWSALIGAANVPSVGSQLTKQNAAYWEVPLSTIGDSAITNYDVLILPAANLVSLNPSEKGRLQKFMDQGGVLWVDVSDKSSVDAANGLPVAFTVNNSVGPHGATVLNSTSQLTSSPYTISYLPESAYDNALVAVNLGGAGFGSLVPILSDVGPDFQRFEIVGKDGLGGPATVLYAKVGDGALVVTGRGTSAFLNQATVNGSISPNNGFTAITSLPDSNSSMVARFAINAINLVGGFSQATGGSRSASSNPVSVGAPLLQSWKDETVAGGTPGAPPITYKGLVFVTLGNRLYAYSATPGSDLYNTGNPDDGIQDYSLGRGRDLVWQSQLLNGPLSAPVAMPVPAAGGNNTDQVFVVDHAGNLVAFPVFPSVSSDFTNITPIKSYSPPGGPPNSTGNAPLPPVEHDGLVYVTDNQESGGQLVGRVWVVDPLNQNSVSPNGWSAGGQTTQVVSQAATAAVTIGYIPIFDNSGGVDKVAYMPLQHNNSNTCGIASLWAGVKGERHSISEIGNQSTPSAVLGQISITTRAGSQGCNVYLPSGGGASALGPHLTLINANGDALSVAQTASLFAGTFSSGSNSPAGTLVFNMQPSVSLDSFTALGVTAIVLDYSIDWDNSSNATKSVSRGVVNLPDQAGSSATQDIIGNLSLSPAGTLYAVEGTIGGTSNGTFYEIREQGRGLFTFVGRFDLYPKFQLNLSSGTSQTVPTTFEDNDGLTQIPGAAPFLGGTLSGMYFASGPTVRGSTVYVKAHGTKTGTSGFPVPSTILLAFAAEPSLPQFTVPALADGYTILQPDIGRSSDAFKTSPDTFTQLTTGQVTYSVTAGNANGTLTFNNLAGGNRGSVNQIFSESLPIILRQPSKPDIVMYPDTTGSWSPLQWYAMFGGVDDNSIGAGGTGLISSGNPVVAGNTLYFGGNSYLPLILTGISPFGATPTGVMIGMNANISASDPFLFPNVSRPWFKQLQQIQIPAAGGISTNPDILWPQNVGVTDVNTFTQRLLQTSLGGSDTTTARTFYGLVAGDGGLYAYSNLGVYGYTHADFTIADQNRVATFDPDGNALWTTNATLTSGLGTPNTAGAAISATVRSLVRPTRAYPVGENYLITDPGANRVALIDKTGREIRTIETFTVDPAYVPIGYTAGEPLALQSPGDAFTFTDIQTASPFSNATGTEFWRHYVIADTGNHRLVEIVDRFGYDTSSGQPTNPIALGVLYYHSPAVFTGKSFDYNAVSRILVPTPTPHFVYVAATRGVTPSLTDLGVTAPAADPVTGNPAIRTAGAGAGGIIVLDGDSTKVINTINIPAMAAGTIYDPTSGTFNSQAIPAHQARIGNISSVTMSNYLPDGSTGAPVLRIMFTDSSGIYEIVPDSTGTVWTVDWMLPSNVYTVMRWSSSGGNISISGSNPLGFQPGYARRTSANTVIVANSYVGYLRGGASFGGEVLELEGDIAGTAGGSGFSFNSPFLGFSPLSIRFQLPGVTGTRGLIGPVFADRQ